MHRKYTNKTDHRKMKNGRKLALWGACLQIAPVFALLVAILGPAISIFASFSQLTEFGQNAQESSDALASNMSIAMSLTAIGIIAAFIGLFLGLICLLVALFSHRYRAPWFFWFMTIYSLFSLLAFPVGTVIGIIVLVHIIPRKEEFWCDQDGAEQPI
ncbi:MotA/TolQ/ExbB proton channel family protein [Coraliomargarita algicola]|uniref:MotA/TolQ/ExbB proton channel family protein n=1 Tax=Coraliomargarita algicola TaxID=3092156 RepID=A0ABZ0RL55_9BACT|nr:MotA/TolQ/ExbB proton channel family protein [Coraliomargarita sp. J2-16]WPJ96797.1 MotA/TolQ/ExbB proton channel family protein [Coraliomargarita sp. J2-16]